MDILRFGGFGIDFEVLEKALHKQDEQRFSGFGVYDTRIDHG